MCTNSVAPKCAQCQWHDQTTTMCENVGARQQRRQRQKRVISIQIMDGLESDFWQTKKSYIEQGAAESDATDTAHQLYHRPIYDSPIWLLDPKAEFLFMDGIPIFLQDHQRQCGISVWTFYFNQNGPKIKKWDRKIKNCIIWNNSIIWF
jgi:hypothetical protein